MLDLAFGVVVLQADDLRKEVFYLEEFHGFFEFFLVVGGKDRLVESAVGEGLEDGDGLMLQAALDLPDFVFVDEFLSYFFKGIDGKIKAKVAVEILYGKVETGLILG